MRNNLNYIINAVKGHAVPYDPLLLVQCRMINKCINI